MGADPKKKKESVWEKNAEAKNPERERANVHANERERKR